MILMNCLWTTRDDGASTTDATSADDDTDDEEEYSYLQANLCSKCECENIIRLPQVEIPGK